VPPIDEMRPPGYKIDLFSKLPNGIVFACDRFVVAIGDYESMDGVVGTAFLENA